MYECSWGREGLQVLRSHAERGRRYEPYSQTRRGVRRHAISKERLSTPRPLT